MIYIRKEYKQYAFNCVVEQGIIKTVNNINNRVSLDCHDLNMKLVKSVIQHTVESFTYICDKSFEDGIFPEEMKLAKALPFFKSSTKNQLN